MASTLAFRLSRAVQTTISPPIPQARKWAASYVPTPSRPLLDMSQGVPGIPPPDSLLNALAKTSSAPSTCAYCPAEGEMGLRRALAQEMKTVYGHDADITHEDVSLTAGCNMAFVAAIMSVADAGNEVILPVPWYFNHQMSLNLLGIKTVPLPTLSDDGFMPSPERCASLITPRTRAIAIVTPNNPTGAVYSPSLIASLANLARASNIALIMDETYRDFILSGPPHHLFSSSPVPSAPASQPPAPWTWRSNVIHLFSFSKSYCVPGHRLGALVASPAVIQQARTVLDCLQICPPRPLQLALHPLLPSLRPFIQDTARALQARHALFRACLPRRWRIGSQGAYYAFVKHPWRHVDATEVSRRLARDAGVVTLPAGFFSDEGAGARTAEDEHRWIRFSVANVDDEKVRRVCERLEECESEFGWELEERCVEVDATGAVKKANGGTGPLKV